MASPLEKKQRTGSVNYHTEWPALRCFMAPAGQQAVIREGVKREEIRKFGGLETGEQGLDWVQFKQCQ